MAIIRVTSKEHVPSMGMCVLLTSFSLTTMVFLQPCEMGTTIIIPLTLKEWTRITQLVYGGAGI